MYTQAMDVGPKEERKTLRAAEEAHGLAGFGEVPLPYAEGLVMLRCHDLMLEGRLQVGFGPADGSGQLDAVAALLLGPVQRRVSVLHQFLG